MFHLLLNVSYFPSGKVRQIPLPYQTSSPLFPPENLLHSSHHNTITVNAHAFLNGCSKSVKMHTTTAGKGICPFRAKLILGANRFLPRRTDSDDNLSIILEACQKDFSTNNSV